MAYSISLKMTKTNWITIDGTVMGEKGFLPAKLLELLIGRKSDLDVWAEEGYDKEVEEWQWVAPEIITEMAIPYFNPEDHVLDAGCGTGLVGEILVKQGYTIDGIDLSPKMLEYAKERGYRELRSANLAQPSLADFIGKKYKSIISAGVYGDFINVNPWLSRLCDVLEENGTLAITGSRYKLTEYKVFKYLEQNGLEVKEIRTGIGYFAEKQDPIKCLYIIAQKTK